MEKCDSQRVSNEKMDEPWLKVPKDLRKAMDEHVEHHAVDYTLDGKTMMYDKRK